MKLITSNFITCAGKSSEGAAHGQQKRDSSILTVYSYNTVKACRGTAEAYPLQFSSVELEQTELEYNPRFICNIMPRIEWPALVAVCRQLGNDTLPPEKPEDLDAENPEHEQVLRSLHNVLLQVRHNPHASSVTW